MTNSVSAVIPENEPSPLFVSAKMQLVGISHTCTSVHSTVHAHVVANLQQLCIHSDYSSAHCKSNPNYFILMVNIHVYPIIIVILTLNHPVCLRESIAVMQKPYNV